MPTISQLPSVETVTAADEVPVSQNGVTHSVSVGAPLASMQPAVISDSGTLLGRISLGAGGPEQVAIGPGLLLNAGTLAASAFDLADLPQQTVLSPTDHAMLNSNGALALLPVSSLRGLFSPGANISIDANGTISASGTGGGSSGTFSITSLTPVVSIASGDLVAISQAGADRTISYANLLDGLTIDQAQPAANTTDSDTLWVAQGNSTMLRQTFAAIWSWLMAKQPSYKLPVVEITSNTTLDGTVHNGRILICSQPVTLTPAQLNMGSGFYWQRDLRHWHHNVVRDGDIARRPGRDAACCHLLRRHDCVRVVGRQHQWRHCSSSPRSGHEPEREQSDGQQHHAQLVGAEFRRCRQQLHRAISRHGQFDMVDLRDRYHQHHCVSDRIGRVDVV